MTKKDKRFVVGIAGGSGSGKTTFAHRVLMASAKAGISGQIFSLDNYYKPLKRAGIDKLMAYNFDHPDSIDFDLAGQHLRKLLSGSSIQQPVYDFATATRKAETIERHPTQLVLVEGLYALYPSQLLSTYHFRIFISTGLATAVLRRVERDIGERGRDVQWSKHQILSTVLPMYETYVKPTQKNAHFSINWEGEEIPEKAAEGLVRMVNDYFR